jgi:hypothetical protein
MLKNHHLAQAISDANMGEIRRQLQYKAEKFGARLAVIDRFYPSSKTCSLCGWVNEDLGLSQRMFVCLDCGYFADRDYNAAKNILAVSSTESLNACGAGSSGLVATRSETARCEAGTKQQLGGTGTHTRPGWELDHSTPGGSGPDAPPKDRHGISASSPLALTPPGRCPVSRESSPHHISIVRILLSRSVD